MRRMAVLAAWAATMSGPAGAETIRIEGIFAAGAREASLLPTIGVDAFAGPQGDELGAAVERRLAAIDDDGVPHAQAIAPALRPDGLLGGRTDVAVHDDRYVERRRRCVEKDKDGKCTRRETYDVRCVRRTIALRADLRLVRRQDGRVVYAAAKSRDDDDSACDDGGFLTSIDSALDGMVESIAKEVRLDLAAHRERYTIRIREERSGLPPADAARFHAAVRLTKRDQPAACQAFAAIGQAVPDHGPTLFNRALCAEAAGRYAEAGDLYARARVFGARFGGDVTKGLERIASLRAGAEDMARLATIRADGGTPIALAPGTPPR